MFGNVFSMINLEKSRVKKRSITILIKRKNIIYRGENMKHKDFEST